MAEEYLANRDELVLSIQLIDSRHEPTALDKQLHEWMIYNEKPHIIVATKADKLSSNKLQKSLKEIGNQLPESRIIAYSSQTGKGRDELWQVIEQSLINNK